jgi:hypothetical protein
MDASSSPSDAERELDELRRRAYGPHPDIQFDPAALARLTELEAARTASPPDGADTEIGEPAAAADGAPVAVSAWAASRADRPDPAAAIAPVVASSEGSPRSLWHRLRARRSSFVAGALVAFFALAYTVAWLVGPHPDATLYPVADEADGVVLSLLEFLGADANPSSIRGYQPYRGVEPWFSEERQGFQCFMIVERSSRTVDGANCVPPGVDLFADIGAEGLPDGSIIRFHYRGDSVDVFLYPASEAD